MGRLVEAMATRRTAYSPMPAVRRILARHRATVPGTEVVQL
jgi:hypothetical protein